MNIRYPAVAGLFYPAEATALKEQIAHFILELTMPQPVPKAVIAPHAGYSYSGPIAGTAYAHLRQNPAVHRVVLLGPSHYVPFDGLALSSAAGYATPLGIVPVDLPTCAQLANLPQVRYLNSAHEREHSLEVHLPFLQMAFTDFRLVPVVVGYASPADVAEAIELLWGGPETVIVISSDLSHYHSAPAAAKLDAKTASQIEHLNLLHEGQACGMVPINGLLHYAHSHPLTARTLDLRSSGDTGGPRDRVVGYGAFAFYEPSSESAPGFSSSFSS